jgi:bla regulator protein BlaR1
MTTAMLMQLVGTALINFVWQGAIIGIVTAVLLRQARNADPKLRYAIAGVALAVCLAMPFWSVVIGSMRLDAAPGVDSMVTGEGMTKVASLNLLAVWGWLEEHAVQFVAIWLCCVVMLSIRLAAGLVWVARVAGAVQGHVDPAWQARLDALARRAGISTSVPLRDAPQLNSPAVVGWLRPAVLMPTALLAGLPVDLVEALLAHEVAHIYRKDYLVNLVQSAVEILLFYHPAVWWISKQIRIEREQIADDIAAAMIEEPRHLALALGELEQIRYAGTQLAMTASGGDLVTRIIRLIDRDPKPFHVVALMPVIALVFAGLAMYAHATNGQTSTATVKTDMPVARLDFSSCRKPEYPKTAFDQKLEGTVRMVFSIDATGHVASANVEQSSGHADLDGAALNALKLCSFTPATQHGKPVDSSTTVSYVWKLQG